MYELLLGEFSFRAGDPQAGYAFMLDAARRSGDGALYRRATEMAIQSRSGPAALEAARAWRQAEPSSADANRYELQVLMALGRTGETEAALRATLAALPAEDRVGFITAIPALYARSTDKPQAAQLVEKALADTLKNKSLAPAAWTSIGRMRLQADDKNGALAAARQGHSADPAAEWPILLALQLMGDKSDMRAEPLVRDYLRSSAAKPELRSGYARVLADSGRSAEALTQLSELTQRHPTFADGWLVQGLVHAQARRDVEAQNALERFLSLAEPSDSKPASASSRSGLNQAYLALSQIAERRGDLPGAQSWLAKVSSEEGLLTLVARRAALLARQGRLDEARDVLRAAPVTKPEDARLKVLAEAQLLRENKRPKDAYELLRAELAKAPDDEDLLYETAMAAEKNGDLADMERLLRQLIAANPRAYNAYNALGYSMADRGDRLPEAKSLIQKAVELSPDDAFIQDSLGWVEFRLGRHAEAARILEAAFKKQPDAEIAAHLGEVLWVRGQRERAMAVWREGRRLNPDNETLVETLRRLRVRL